MTAAVVLTIDVELSDRPSADPAALAAMVDVLADRSTPAVLFVEGRWARGHFSELEDAARRVPPGTIFGLHGDHHVPFDRLSRAGIERELRACAEAIAPVVEPVPLLRLPYGVGWTDALVRHTTARLGVKVVGWDVGVRDWDTATSFAAALGRAAPAWQGGGVVLLHQWPRRSPDLLAAIIDRTVAAGAQIAPLDSTSLSREVATGLVPRVAGDDSTPPTAGSRNVH